MNSGMHPLNLNLTSAFSELIKEHNGNGGLILEIMGKALEARGITFSLRGIGKPQQGTWRAGKICLLVEDTLWSGKGESFFDWDNALTGLVHKLDISGWTEERTLEITQAPYSFPEKYDNFQKALDIEIARRQAWVMARDTIESPTPCRSPSSRL